MNKLIILIVAVMLSACGGRDEDITIAPPPPSLPPSVERTVAPAATDAAINTGLENHIAINPGPDITTRNRLFVFLPATAATPFFYRSILRTGALRGYHAIGLNYPNQISVGELCTLSDDVDCHGKVRKEIITGMDFSALGNMLPANAIVNRLQKMLVYLHANYPNEGWGHYLSDGQVNWAKVNLAGHSQGGGHVGMMSKMFALNRASYFSSPGDWRYSASPPINEVARWTALPDVTDPSRQFGFSHIQDELSTLTANVWDIFGLNSYGPLTSVDGLSPPFGGSHTLTSNATPNTMTVQGNGHNATVMDLATPRNAAGAALYQPVWIYLCFP